MRSLLKATLVVALSAAAWVLLSAFLIMCFAGVVQLTTQLGH